MRDGIDRRQFLELGGSTLVAFSGLSGARSLSAASDRGVVVVVFQRGAADALHMLVPYRERRYREIRGALALEEPGRGESPTLDVGSGFAFHPALSPLHPLYRAGRLAAVVNVGSPDPTRSHFDAQDYMESGTPGVKSTRSGWLARAIETFGGASASAFTGVALSAQMPRSLAGARHAMALQDFSKMEPRSGGDSLLSKLAELYARDGSDRFAAAGEEGLRARQMFRERDPLSIPVREGARYPRGRAGEPLRQLAKLIKADLGVRVAFVESEGWDTHFGQGGASGQMANLMRGLAESLTAFVTDVGGDVPLTVVVATEFGRTVAPNGAGGTDHGHGGAMLLLGDGIRGGRVHGDWLGLDRRNLYQGRDLPVTTDFRDVFSEVAEQTLGLGADVELFPGHAPKRLGVVERG